MTILINKEIKEILIKNWMTHDGMWFYHCYKECGIETTNKINKAAVKSMSLIEINRLKEFLDIYEIKTYEELKNLVKKIFEVVKADFMKFSYSFPSHNIFQFDMNECFAYNGVKRIGALENYVCGIYDRIDSWFKGLGIKYEVYPKINGCLMRDKGYCTRTYKFFFK